MSGDVRNYGKSVRAKLLGVAKSNNVFYQTILTRYFQERLLFRISKSSYRSNFILKGGALMYVYEHLAARPTLDIDFLGTGISNEGEAVANAFSEICCIACEEDGVMFDTTHISFHNITEFKEYHGIRLSIPVRMDTISQVLMMDIGFGDVITPAPVDTDYPVLLDNMPRVNVMAYSIETVVAEKVHAIIDLAEENSRMKDYYDLYTILSGRKYDQAILEEAMIKTFSNRHAKYDRNTMFFRPEFSLSNKMKIKWQAFMKKIAVDESLTFRDVTLYLQEKLLPYWKKLEE